VALLGLGKCGVAELDDIVGAQAPIDGAVIISEGDHVRHAATRFGERLGNSKGSSSMM
jgi:hypothetical protein